MLGLPVHVYESLFNMGKYNYATILRSSSELKVSSNQSIP